MDSNSFKENILKLNFLTNSKSFDNDPDLKKLKAETQNLKELLYFDNEDDKEDAIIDKSFDEMVIISKKFN